MVLASTIDFTLPLADPVLKFLLILLIILAAPLLLNKLRIPHLLGLIIAGEKHDIKQSRRPGQDNAAIP